MLRPQTLLNEEVESSSGLSDRKGKKRAAPDSIEPSEDLATSKRAKKSIGKGTSQSPIPAVSVGSSKGKGKRKGAFKASQATAMPKKTPSVCRQTITFCMTDVVCSGKQKKAATPVGGSGSKKGDTGKWSFRFPEIHC